MQDIVRGLQADGSELAQGTDDIRRSAKQSPRECGEH